MKISSGSFISAWWGHRKELQLAQNALNELRDREKVSGNAWDDMQRIMAETTGIEQAFAQGEWDVCRRIIEWWVERIEVWVEKVPPALSEAAERA